MSRKTDEPTNNAANDADEAQAKQTPTEGEKTEVAERSEPSAKPPTQFVATVPGLTENDEQRLIDAKPEIEKAYRAVGESCFSLGSLLRRAKGELKHRVFGAWVDAELPFSNRTAQYYMQVDEVLGKDAGILSHLQFITLRALAQPQLTVQARSAIVRDIAAGKLYKDEDVLARIAKAPSIAVKQEKLKAERQEMERKRHEALFDVAVALVEAVGDQLHTLVPQLRAAGLNDLVELIGKFADIPGDTDVDTEQLDLNADENGTRGDFPPDVDVGVAGASGADGANNSMPAAP